MSKYAQSAGNNNWGEGNKIIPVTYLMAQEWAEEKLDGEEYESIFGEVVEDDSRISIGISISKTAHEKVNNPSLK